MDIIHDPKPVDDLLTQFKCSDCGMELPQAVCLAAAGWKVIEIGDGAGFIPAIEETGSISCKHPSAEQQRSVAEKARDIVMLEVKTLPGEQVKAARPLTETERQVNKMGYDNFVALREATKLRET